MPCGSSIAAAIWLQVSCSRTPGEILEPVSAYLFPKSANGTACSLSYLVKIARSRDECRQAALAAADARVPIKSALAGSRREIGGRVRRRGGAREGNGGRARWAERG